MSALIKSSSLSPYSVRSFAAKQDQPAAEPSPTEQAIAALAQEVDRLTALLKEREAAAGAHEAEVERAYQVGEEAGRRAGLEAADQGREAAFSRLAAGIDEALARFAAELGNLENLAGLVAEAGLEKVIGGSEGYADLVGKALALNIRRLERSTVVRIEVCQTDFPDAQALKVLSGRAAGLAVQTSGELGPGDCQIRLTLGGLDIGIPHQWRELKAVLQSLADDRVGLQ